MISLAKIEKKPITTMVLYFFSKKNLLSTFAITISILFILAACIFYEKRRKPKIRKRVGVAYNK